MGRADVGLKVMGGGRGHGRFGSERGWQSGKGKDRWREKRDREVKGRRSRVKEGERITSYFFFVLWNFQGSR